jgi:hypothetical protein
MVVLSMSVGDAVTGAGSIWMGTVLRVLPVLCSRGAEETRSCDWRSVRQ